MIKLPAFNIGFDTIREARDQLSRSLDIIEKALLGAAPDADVPTDADIRAAITFYTFVAPGHNGVGSVSLPPTVDPFTGRIFRRVLPGARLISAFDPVTFGGFERMTQFETVISQADQIQQTSALNLTGFNMLFFVLT